MWSDMQWPYGPGPAHALGHNLAVRIGLTCLVAWLPALHAAESDPLIPCKPTSAKGHPASADAIEEGVECGAEVGNLGLEWRQKLPAKVRWITRKDAKALCGQKSSEWGQRVGSPLAQGCVFLTPQACTILTNGYISHATLGNAVRACSP